MFVNTSTFFKYKKIAQAVKVCAVCGLWKILRCIFTQSYTRNHVIAC